MEKFDRATLKIIREDLNEALKTVCDKHGLIQEIGNIRFDSDSFTTKLSMRIQGGMSEMEKDYKQFYEPQSKYPPLNSIVKIMNENYQIIGSSSRAKKYPIIGKKISDGKRYKFSDEIVSKAYCIPVA